MKFFFLERLYSHLANPRISNKKKKDKRSAQKGFKREIK
jgi:hypothetical protein